MVMPLTANLGQIIFLLICIFCTIGVVKDFFDFLFVFFFKNYFAIVQKSFFFQFGQ